jgi:hypothetical protein
MDNKTNETLTKLKKARSIQPVFKDATNDDFIKVVGNIISIAEKRGLSLQNELVLNQELFEKSLTNKSSEEIELLEMEYSEILTNAKTQAQSREQLEREEAEKAASFLSEAQERGVSMNALLNAIKSAN